MNQQTTSRWYEHLDGPWRAERRVLGLLIRIAFAIAGLSWLPILVLELDGHARISFTLGQYQLYLLLLTLWGYHYRRELGRSECVLQCALNYQRNTMIVTWDDITTCGCVDRFDVLRRRPQSRAWFPLVFTWGLLVAAYIWLGRQVVVVVGNLVSP
jgi:hypothetical protein